MLDIIEPRNDTHNSHPCGFASQLGKHQVNRQISADQRFGSARA